MRRSYSRELFLRKIDALRKARPDIALLPIGGFWPRSFRARHMSPLDALYAFGAASAELIFQSCST